MTELREYRLFKTDWETHDGRMILDPVIDMEILPLLVHGDGHDDSKIVDKVARVSRLPQSDWWTGWTEYDVPEGHFLSPSFDGGTTQEADGVYCCVGLRLRSLVVLPLDKACWDGYTAPLPTRARFV